MINKDNGLFIEKVKRKTTLVIKTRTRRGQNSFKDLILKLIKAKFMLVFIDKWSFNSSAIPIYSWMKKGEPAGVVIRNTIERYNSIAAQWEDNVYFMLKNETSNEESVWCFIKLLIKKLMQTVNKHQSKLRTVFLQWIMQESIKLIK